MFLTYHMDLYLIVHQVLVFRMQIPLMSGVYHNFKKPITQLQFVRMGRGLGFQNAFQVTLKLLSILMKKFGHKIVHSNYELIRKLLFAILRKPHEKVQGFCFYISRSCTAARQWLASRRVKVEKSCQWKEAIDIIRRPNKCFQCDPGFSFLSHTRHPVNLKHAGHEHPLTGQWYVWLILDSWVLR